MFILCHSRNGQYLTPSNQQGLKVKATYDQKVSEQ